jgi:hypothetical protein
MSTAAELSNAGDSSSELRERKKVASPDRGTNGVSTGSSQEEKPKEGQETWGRTPDGTGMYILVNSAELQYFEFLKPSMSFPPYLTQRNRNPSLTLSFWSCWPSRYFFSSFFHLRSVVRQCWHYSFSGAPRMIWD